jgi:hypothetical protein
MDSMDIGIVAVVIAFSLAIAVTRIVTEPKKNRLGGR